MVLYRILSILIRYHNFIEFITKWSVVSGNPQIHELGIDESGESNKPLLILRAVDAPTQWVRPEWNELCFIQIDVFLLLHHLNTLHVAAWHS